jgi:hypothetical protein
VLPPAVALIALFVELKNASGWFYLVVTLSGIGKDPFSAVDFRQNRAMEFAS